MRSADVPQRTLQAQTDSGAPLTAWLVDASKASSASITEGEFKHRPPRAAEYLRARSLP